MISNLIFSLALIAAFITFASPFPADAQGDDGMPPWYRQIVFEGRVLQTPLTIGENELIVMTDDKHIQRLHVNGNILWQYDFAHLPWGMWYVQGNGEIHIPVRDTLLSFSPRGFIGKTPFFRSLSSQGEEIALVDGRGILIDEHNTVHIFSSAFQLGDMPLMSWKLPVRSWKKLLVSQEETIIIQTDEQLLWYSIDGILITHISIQKNWNEFIVHGREFLIHSPASGQYRRYTLSGKELQGGKTPGNGRLIALLFFRNTTLYIHIDNRRLKAVTSENTEYELYNLPEPWEYEFAALHKKYLHVSDSVWRIHRFDMQMIAENFSGGTLLPPAQDFPEKQYVQSNFLSDFLISLVGNPERLREQLEIIDKTDNLQGKLLMYESALHNVLLYIYAASDRYTLVGPCARALILRLFLRYGGGERCRPDQFIPQSRNKSACIH